MARQRAQRGRQNTSKNSKGKQSSQPNGKSKSKSRSRSRSRSRSKGKSVTIQAPSQAPPSLKQVAKETGTTVPYVKKARKESLNTPIGDQRLSPIVVDSPMNYAAASAFRAVVEASITKCASRTTSPSHTFQALARYVQWAAVSVFSPNGNSLSNYAHNVAPTGVRPSEFPPFPSEYYVPRPIIEYVHHCCGKKTKAGVKYDPKFIFASPEASSDLGTGYVIPRALSTVTSANNFYGSDPSDDDYSILGNTFLTPNTAMTQEITFKLNSVGNASYDNLWDQTEVGKALRKSISDWFQTSGCCEPMSVFWSWKPAGRSLPVAPDYSANAFPVPTNIFNNTQQASNPRYACAESTDHWDPDVACFLGGTLAVDATAGLQDLSWADFISLKLYYANAMDASPFPYKRNGTSWGLQVVSHKHVTWFVDLLSTEPLHPRGIKKTIMNHRLLPGIKKMAPRYSLLSCSQWNQRLVETMIQENCQGQIPGIQIANQGALAAMFVLANSVLTAHVIRHCGGWAEQLLLNNEDPLSGVTTHDNYLSARMPMLLSSLISQLGPTIDECGQLTFYVLDSRPMGNVGPTWSGTAQSYSNLMYSGYPASIDSTPGPTNMQVGNKFPLTPSWWLFLMNPNFYTLATTAGRAYLPYQIPWRFSSSNNTGTSYSDHTTNLIPYKGTSNVTPYDVAPLFDFSSITAYPVPASASYPPRIPVMLWDYFSNAFTAYTQNRSNTVLCPRKFGHIGLMSCSSVNFVLNQTTTQPLILATDEALTQVRLQYNNVVQYVGSQYALTRVSAGLALASCWSEFTGNLNSGTNNSNEFGSNNLTGYCRYRYKVNSSNTTSFTAGTITSALAETEIEKQVSTRAALFKGIAPMFAQHNAIEQVLGNIAASGVVGEFGSKGIHNYQNSVLLKTGCYPYFPENNRQKRVDYHGSPTVADEVSSKADWAGIGGAVSTGIGLLFQLLPFIFKEKFETCESELHRRGLLFGKFDKNDITHYVVMSPEGPRVSTEDALEDLFGLRKRSYLQKQ